ncbi:MAG: hypothetical protein H6Q19_1677 [Bacteroidetes bacterium]|nr:hypothetical protein [Bacteroidota bacterium]
MKDFVDYVEYIRPDNAKVRVAFEMLGNEVLFYFCEYQHTDKGEWKLMVSSDSEYFNYSVENEKGETRHFSIKYPTKEEIEKAQQLIINKYNILSI